MPKRIVNGLGGLFRSLVSIMIGLLLGLLIAMAAGEDPGHLLHILFKGAFGSQFDLGMTLFYATPLIFTGLSVSIALQSGLFNVGAEGQMMVGALAAAAVGICFKSIPAPLAPILAGLTAFVAGAFWGAIPGWLRARRGAHEVISTIMLNFVAAGLTSWVALYVLKNPTTHNPETLPIGDSYTIPIFSFFDGAPVNLALIVAIIAALLLWSFLKQTVLGYEVRAVGQNESAARVAGIDPGKIRILSMVLAGGFAGLVGVNEVLGSARCFKIGFSPGYGFTGIAVALLGRNRPLGVLAAALLFGALQKGSLELDLESEVVTRDLALILQALIILCVSADGVWSLWGESIKLKWKRLSRSKENRKLGYSEQVK